MEGNKEERKGTKSERTKERNNKEKKKGTKKDRNKEQRKQGRTFDLALL